VSGPLFQPSADHAPRVVEVHEADERVGYFTTVYRDLGKFRDDQKWVRYVNRWDIQKRDPSLKLSPPKQPIVYYIDNNVPVRYRRWVRQGVLEWNKAFEKIGISDARCGNFLKGEPGSCIKLQQCPLRPLWPLVLR
jgi:hypothetical protein